LGKEGQPWILKVGRPWISKNEGVPLGARAATGRSSERGRRRRQPHWIRRSHRRISRPKAGGRGGGRAAPSSGLVEEPAPARPYPQLHWEMRE
jgi:hypothetical protein